MPRFVHETTESVGTRYSATVFTQVDADTRETARRVWEAKQRLLDGTEDSDRVSKRDEFAFHSKGYRAKLEAVYKLTNKQSELLQTLPFRIPTLQPDPDEVLLPGEYQLAYGDDTTYTLAVSEEAEQ